MEQDRVIRHDCSYGVTNCVRLSSMAHSVLLMPRQLLAFGLRALFALLLFDCILPLVVTHGSPPSGVRQTLLITSLLIKFPRR
jgi:hypothetical protein